MTTRNVTATFLILGLLACKTASQPVPSANDPIRVYVYYVNQGTHEPVGAKVFVLGSDDCVIATEVTDSAGVAVFSSAFDSSRTKYFFAELRPLLLTGVPWSEGRREYNLPLQVEPLVNRVTVRSQ